MTLKELERYLKIQKLQEGARRGVDMCGRYARCSYCDRFEQYPCAKAHNIYMRALELGAAQNSELCPEPPVEEVFGAKYAEEGQTESPEQEDTAQENAEAEEKEEPQKPQRVSRGAVRRGKGEVRVLSVKKKPHTEAEGGN